MAVRIAGARADFERRYGGEPAEVLKLVRQLAASPRLYEGEERMQCPARGSPGTGLGDHEVDWDYEPGDDGRFRATHGKVWFNAGGFGCTVCGLGLEDEAELAAAGLELR